MKKEYRKATMLVVNVETESHLLSGSDTGAYVRADYVSAGAINWN